ICLIAGTTQRQTRTLNLELNMANLAGKTAIVTGATRGIGLAVARALLERKVRVVLCARNPFEVERTVASLKADFGENVSGIDCDVGNPESVQSLFDHLRSTFG